MKYLIVALSLFLSLPAQAATSSLEDDIKGLDVEGAAPAQITKEKLYSIQSRSSPLRKHLEILVGFGENFTGDSFLASEQVGAELQYHVTDDWSVALAYNQVFNKFKDAADNMLVADGLLPDVDFVRSRQELRVQYNLFYGKFRFTKDSVLYFDQYVSLGFAQNELGSGSSPGPVGDAGFAFWISDWGSLHLGVKDYYYEEKSRLSSGSHHNIHGYVQAGYLL
jgi:outer membrane beta-barrel protein